jgi:hypothetical protein
VLLELPLCAVSSMDDSTGAGGVASSLRAALVRLLGLLWARGRAPDMIGGEVKAKVYQLILCKMAHF